MARPRKVAVVDQTALAEQQTDKIDAFIAKMNADMKGVGRVDRGSKIAYIDPPRIESGILGLDIVANGGLPRGGFVQFYGPFSTAKTTTALKVIVADQQSGKDTLFCAAEGFVKEWARQAGVWIPYSDDEYKHTHERPDLSVEQKLDFAERMRGYDEWGTLYGYGSFSVLQHVHGDGLLEAAAQAIKANLFSIVVIDSLAVLRNARQLEEQEVGQEDMGGGGQIRMFNNFSARCFSALNTKYAPDGLIDMAGGVGNSTLVIALNQARIKMGAQGPKRPGQVSYQATGGEGIKHWFHLSVLFKKGEQLGDMVKMDGYDVWTPYAQEIDIKSEKSKIGPPFRSASWHLYTANHGDMHPGMVDVAREIRMWGVYYQLIDQSGAWYSYNGDRIGNGKENVDLALASNPELQSELRTKILDLCRQ